MDEPIERNRKLFYQVAEYIETYPERYDQEDWGSGQLEGEIFNGKQLTSCGSTMCIAGTTAMLEGWVPEINDWVCLQKGKKTGIVDNIAHAALGFPEQECGNSRIFDGGWHPVHGMSVPDALRALGDGADVDEISCNMIGNESCADFL